jgi:hypothetical protein
MRQPHYDGEEGQQGIAMMMVPQHAPLPWADGSRRAPRREQRREQQMQHQQPAAPQVAPIRHPWRPKKAPVVNEAAAAFWRGVQGIDMFFPPPDGFAPPVLDVEDLGLDRDVADLLRGACDGSNRLPPLLQHALPEALRGSSVGVAGPSGSGALPLIAAAAFELCVRVDIQRRAERRRQRSASAKRAAPVPPSSTQVVATPAAGLTTDTTAATPALAAPPLTAEGPTVATEVIAPRAERGPAVLILTPTRESEDEALRRLRGMLRYAPRTMRVTVGRGIDPDSDICVSNAGVFLSSPEDTTGHPSAVTPAMVRCLSAVRLVAVLHGERLQVPPFTTGRGVLQLCIPPLLLDPASASGDGRGVNRAPVQWIITGNEPGRVHALAANVQRAAQTSFVGYTARNRGSWVDLGHAVENIEPGQEMGRLLEVLARGALPAVVVSSTRRGADAISETLRGARMRVTTQLLDADAYDVVVATDASLRGCHRRVRPFAHLVNFELPIGAYGPQLDDALAARREVLGAADAASSGHPMVMTTFLRTDLPPGAARDYARFVRVSGLPEPEVKVQPPVGAAAATVSAMHAL